MYDLMIYTYIDAFKYTYRHILDKHISVIGGQGPHGPQGCLHLPYRDGVLGVFEYRNSDCRLSWSTNLKSSKHLCMYVFLVGFELYPRVIKRRWLSNPYQNRGAQLVKPLNETVDYGLISQLGRNPPKIPKEILVGGLEHGFYFSKSWEFHHPN